MKRTKTKQTERTFQPKQSLLAAFLKALHNSLART